jgi:serine acetyltransferase
MYSIYYSDKYLLPHQSILILTIKYVAMFTDDLCCSQYETSGLLIPVQVFGTGLSIAHSGTIVVRGSAQGGRAVVSMPAGNIGVQAGPWSSAPHRGNNGYRGPGAHVGDSKIADTSAIGANAFVNKSSSGPEIVLPRYRLKKSRTQDRTGWYHEIRKWFGEHKTFHKIPQEESLS